MPFLSIIVPVFNAERYIRQCIESILNQSYLNYELILIDDGSTDSSGLICDEYLNRENVIVIHKKNAGHISARKDGVKYAKGKYIGFVDADDYVKRDMYEHMCTAAKQEGIDIVICDAYQVNDNKLLPLKQNIPYGIYDKNKLIREVYPIMICTGKYYEFGILPALWNKIFRKELLEKNMHFVDEKIRLGEDALWTYLCMLDAQSMTYQSNYEYYYRNNFNSICHKWSDLNIESTRILLENSFNALQPYSYPNLMTELENYAVYMLSNMLFEWQKSKINIKEFESNSEALKLRQSKCIKEMVTNCKEFKIPWYRSLAIKCFYNNSKVLYILWETMIKLENTFGRIILRAHT